MKKIACILLALALSLSLAACGKGGSDGSGGTLSETAAYDPETDGDIGALAVVFWGDGEDTAGLDLSLWTRDMVTDHTEKGAPETASITLMGRTFEGRYAYSATFYPATHISHYYKGDFGGFAVNSETGAIDSFNAAYAETEKKIGAEQCRKRADAVAETFSELSDYTVSETERETDIYYLYTKNVEGLPSSDTFGVGISFYGGGITVLGSSLAGSVASTEENFSAARRLRSAIADAEDAIKAKIAGRYTGEYDMMIDDFSLACLPGGKLALKTTVEVTVQVADDYDDETYY